jgi:hypothetical protein
MLHGNPQSKSGPDATPSGLSPSLNSGVTSLLLQGVADSGTLASHTVSARNSWNLQTALIQRYVLQDTKTFQSTCILPCYPYRTCRSVRTIVNFQRPSSRGVSPLDAGITTTSSQTSLLLYAVGLCHPLSPYLVTWASDDPAAWGYLPLGDQPSYVPDPNQTHPPFQLYTIGSGSLSIPDELKNIVVVKTGLSYPGKA